MIVDNPESTRMAVLGCINEECGEVIHIIGKIMRHGEKTVDTHVTGDGTEYDNLTDLRSECAQVVAAIAYATERGLFKEQLLSTEVEIKLTKLRRIHGTGLLP